MTLVVGMHCKNSIVLGAEQEEASGYTTKKSVQKLKLYQSQDWALGFSGAGEAAVIDGVERRLSKWLKNKHEVTKDELCDSLESILAEVFTNFVDKDPRSEGISLIVGASCKDGLLLLKSQKNGSSS